MTARERLVQSAQELLWERGYVAMSPKAIQDRSGAGQGSMYHHFSGKLDLAAVAIESSAANFREGAEQCLAKAGTPLERLRGYLLRSREALKGCQIGKLTQDPEIASEPRLRQPLEITFAWLHDRLKALIEEAQTSGEINSALNADEIAATLIATIQGGYVLASAAASPKPFRQAVRGILSLLG
jgi:TetR/AcrR family transcriptional regulator, transcriptional repressor for nem operon